MPEINFTQEERDEIERLVTKHSPRANEKVMRSLNLVSEETRETIIGRYEKALTEIARLGVVAVSAAKKANLECVGSLDDYKSGVKDALMVLDSGDTFDGHLAHKLMDDLWGTGDDTPAHELYGLAPELANDLIDTHLPGVEEAAAV